MKSFHRAQPGEPAALPGQPVVHVTQFDGPRPTTTSCPVDISGNWSPKKELEVGACGGRVTVTHGASTETTISLASGRRVAGVLVTNDADPFVNDEGELILNPSGPAPGVSTYVFTDAVGASYCHDVNQLLNPRVLTDPGTYGGLAGGTTGNTIGTTTYDIYSIPLGLGQHSGPTGTGPGAISSGPDIPMVGMGSALTSSDGTDQNADAGGDDCPCSCGAVNIPAMATVSTDPGTGFHTDANGGFGNFPPGIMFGDGPELREFGSDDEESIARARNRWVNRRVIATPGGVRQDWKELPGARPSLGHVKDEHADNSYQEEIAPPSSAPSPASVKAEKIADLTFKLTLDAVGLASAIGLILTPEPTFVTKAAGIAALAGVILQVIAHVDMLQATIRDTRTAIDEETLAVLEKIGAALELAAGIAMIAKAMPKLATQLDDVAKQIDDLAAAGKQVTKSETTAASVADDLVETAAKPLPVAVAAPTKCPLAKSANYNVYRSISAAGDVQYVGITNNVARRAAEHLRQRGFQIVKLLSGLTKREARAVEQALIELHGLQKNGGTLLNKINSIAKTNPKYASELAKGRAILQKIGYGQ